jgi:hypothetical protein
MVQERVSGNGNFDVDAIRVAASAMEIAPAVANEQDQPPSELSVEEQRAVSAILDIVAEFAANRSAGSGNELEAMLVTAIAAKLPAGTHSQIIGEIFREVERRDRSGFTDFGVEQWERVKKEAKEERERLDKAIDLADSAQQLSTTPDRHGLSEQNYADLNTELQTRDGQERFMAFLRMMNPNLSDADIRQRLEIANAITAERSGRGNAETRRIIESTSPELVEEVTGSLAQYQQISGRDLTQGVTNRVDAQAVEVSAETAAETATVNASLDVLSGTNTDQALSLSSDANPAVATRLSVSAQLNNQENFGGAPSLSRSFVDANAAIAPLDVRQPQLTSATPVVPVPAVNAGFDV